MIYVQFGSIAWKDCPRQFIRNIDGYFDGYFEDNWIDDWAQKVLLEVDKSKFIAPKIVESPILNTISHEWISGGSKQLIMMNHIQDVVYDGDNLGDNCWPLMTELGKHKDIMITLTYYPIFKEWSPGCIIKDINTGKIATNFDEFNTMHIRSEDDFKEFNFYDINWPCKINKERFKLEEIDF